MNYPKGNCLTQQIVVIHDKVESISYKSRIINLFFLINLVQYLIKQALEENCRAFLALFVCKLFSMYIVETDDSSCRE